MIRDGSQRRHLTALRKDWQRLDAIAEAWGVRPGRALTRILRRARMDAVPEAPPLDRAARQQLRQWLDWMDDLDPDGETPADTTALQASHPGAPPSGSGARPHGAARRRRKRKRR